MRKYPEHESKASEIAYRDFLMNSLLGMTAAVVILMTFVNPEAKEAQPTSTPPGNVVASITWPDGGDDVDLWVDGPGELKPVGYSNKGGILWNLLRDDLGSGPEIDSTKFNYENAFTRGIKAGEYTINVHCFRCSQIPMPVKVEISLNKDSAEAAAKGGSEVILTTKVEIKTPGKEITALRFKLTEDGKLIKDSVNSIFKPLREDKKQ